MTRTNLYAGAARWALFIGLAALPLTGCKPAQTADSPSSAPSSALPLAESGAAIAPAPTASSLPPAPPVPVGHLSNRGDYYAFADHAYAQNQAFGDAPPDYGFDYDGTQPWVWRADDGAMRVAETLPNGGDRYYYYQPGSDYPYLVRDPEYSYGYDNGELVVIYDSRGNALPENEFIARQDHASRFYARGRDLYSHSQQQRQPVAQPNWVARRNEYQAEQQRWAADQAGNAEWHQYHDDHRQQEQAQWSAEQARRANEAVQFNITINDNQAADRDRKIAQDAQARAQAAGPPPAVGGGVFHFGGPQHPPGGLPPVTQPTAGPSAGQAPAGPAATPSGPSGDQGHRHDRPGGPSVAPVGGPSAPPAVAPERHDDHAGPKSAVAPNGQSAGFPGPGGAPKHAASAPPATAFQPGQGVARQHENGVGGPGGRPQQGGAPHAAAFEPKPAAVAPKVEPKPVEAKPAAPKPEGPKPEGPKPPHGPNEHPDHRDEPKGVGQ